MSKWRKERYITAEWIDVNERLPNPYTTVIVALRFKYEYETDWQYETDVALYTGNQGEEWETFNDWDEGQKIIYTHWMPLPELPTETKNDFKE